MTARPFREIRAQQAATTVRVYQAYAAAIAEPALEAQRFVPPFDRDRMTWIKPSFLWMMYRSGWGTKPQQERVLAIDIRREGFEHALASSSLAGFEPRVHGTEKAWRDQMRRFPGRVQWDPERSVRLAALPHRALQLGLVGDLVRRYVDEWIVAITDVGELARTVRDAVRDDHVGRATAACPVETPFAVSAEVAERLGMNRGAAPEPSA